ncbi:MAG: VOC family protein [Tepidiformaceae bacterium]
MISETIFAMLLVEPYFATFTKKPLVDAKARTEVLLALSEESRDAVDARVAKALANGGVAAREVQDLGFMYSRAFEDPDGHTWELMWMDPAAVDG